LLVIRLVGAVLAATLVLAAHWVSLAIAALAAAEGGVRWCCETGNEYGVRTAFILLPEIILAGGVVGIAASRPQQAWKKWWRVTLCAVAALMMVSIGLLADPDLIRAAPPDPFGTWR
jgi:hypothetical protein